MVTFAASRGLQAARAATAEERFDGAARNGVEIGQELLYARGVGGLKGSAGDTYGPRWVCLALLAEPAAWRGRPRAAPASYSIVRLMTVRVLKSGRTIGDEQRAPGPVGVEGTFDEASEGVNQVS